jgi:ribosomal protein S6--L-glutamate ligase
MTKDPDFVTLIYRPHDFEPGYAEEAMARIGPVYSEAAARAGFVFRVIPVSEVLPACPDRPRLWFRGEDLLSTRQCFQVDDFSLNPQAAHFLKAVYRTILASDSVLLNRSVGAPHDLVTDKLAMICRASSLGVPAPATVAVPFGRYARTVIPAVERELGPGPYIVKPREMAMGFAVLKVDTIEQLTAAIDVTAQTGTGYIVQAFEQNAGDMRVYVAGGEPVAAQHRTATDGGYLANVSQRGSASASPCPDGVAALCHRIAASLDASLLAVDWLLTPRGPVLSEWAAGLGGFADLPEPELTRVGDAYFTWARKRYHQTR